VTENFDDDHVKRSACVFEVQDGGPSGVIEPWLNAVVSRDLTRTR
jgi:hypothetical protein